MIALYIIENVKKSHPRNYVADSLIVYMRVLVYLVWIKKKKKKKTIYKDVSSTLIGHTS